MPLGSDAVQVDALREYFLRGVERGDFSACEIADRLGWGRAKGGGRGRQVDSSRVMRSLGVQPYTNRQGRKFFVHDLPYERAVLLCRAMGADPVDFGI